jgi:hypothetical protein
MALARRFLALVSVGFIACSARRQAAVLPVERHVQAQSEGGNTQTTQALSRPLAADAELTSLITSLGAGDSGTLQALNVRLEVGGATELTGERAVGETVRSAQLLVFDRQSAIALLQTSCGNVRLIGLVRAAAQRWQTGASLDVVPHAVPGGCVRATVLAQPIALRSDLATEAAIGVRWEDQMGDEVHGPSLWIASLDPRLGFVMLLQTAPFGGTDDRTGASTEGSVAVMDELPAPRPLFVEIHPARRGTAGAGRERILRRYELRSGLLQMVDEQRQALQVDVFSRPGNGSAESGSDALLPAPR